MVLFKPSFSGVGRLELHAMLDEGTFTRKRRAMKELEKTVVRLQDCLSAAPAPEESCPVHCTAFYLNTLTCNYILASSVSQQWLSAIWFIAFQVLIPTLALSTSSSSTSFSLSSSFPTLHK